MSSPESTPIIVTVMLRMMSPGLILSLAAAGWAESSAAVQDEEGSVE